MSAQILHFLPMEEAPNRIRALRMEAGLSQQKIADGIGVSKVTISDLERGKLRLDTGYMRRIANFLEVAPADLLAKTDNPLALSIRERELITRLREAEAEQQDQLHKVADVMLPWKGPDESERAA